MADVLNRPDWKVMQGDFLTALEDAITGCEQRQDEMCEQADSWRLEDWLLLEDEWSALSRLWSEINHLYSVTQDPAWREPFAEAERQLTAYHSRLTQNERFYGRLKAWGEGGECELPNEARRALSFYLRDFRLSGADLPSQSKEVFAELEQHLVQLSTSFTNHVLDATGAYQVVCEDRVAIDPLPAPVKAYIRDPDHADRWVLGLDQTIYQSVLCFSPSRSLREDLYKAYNTRASNQGPQAGAFDNGPVMEAMVNTRTKMASLLGYDSFAAYAMETRMVESADQAIDFVKGMVEKVKPHAEREWKQLQAYAKSELNMEEVHPWDVAFISESMKRTQLKLDDNQVREYFPMHHVVSKLLSLIERVFSVRLVPVNDQVETWHDQVGYLSVQDLKGREMGGLYVDLFARVGSKQPGAWMDDYQPRQRCASGDLQLPIALLTCNFTPPVPEQISTMTHHDVCTLFHEMGHCLHHLLTDVESSRLSGTNGVPWDGVELPSQFLELWCWQPAFLRELTSHASTGDRMPEAMIAQLNASRTFLSGLALIRQLEFALFDLLVYSDPSIQTEAAIQSVLDKVRADISVVPIMKESRFQNSFSHIFSGGYAAGYYSYLWAEVMSCDAFGRFLEEGLFSKPAGQSFREHVLAPGGARDMLDNFIAFRGRPPEADALLQHYGLVEGGVE